MHIRKMEIHGFKSFPDRVVFHFSEGISGVVGPNGCGKSNVLDAMKWCIGEQSPKELRGSAMEDVVFNGSDARAPMNIAQVTLTFAAGDRPFSGEWARFDEVQITRRLTRGSGSDYRINQQRVRLKDVHELFLDTGVGSRFYSFIEQGRIGAVIAASPQDKRSLVEEAAGTRRFEARRTETLLRLDATLQNLERSVHVVEELEQRLEQVGKQVDRAARFRRLRAIARQASVLLAVAKYSGLMADRRALGRDRREAKMGLERRERAQRLADSDLRRDREQAQVVEAVVGGLRDKLADLEATRRELESARQYQDRERRDLEERAQRLATQVVQAQARIEQAGAELGRCQERVERSQQAVTGARAAVEEQRGRSAEVSQRLESLRSEREERRREHVERRTALERARVRRDSLLRQDLQLRADLEGQERELTSVRADAERLAAARLQAETQLSEGQQRLDATRAARDEARRGLDQRQVELDEAAKHLGEADRGQLAAERVHHRVRARVESLEDLHARHEGLSDASRRVLQRVPGAFAVAEELEVPEDLLEPLAAAMGARTAVVAVEDRADLALAVAAADGGSAWILLLEGGELPTQGLAAAVGGTERARRALSALLGTCERVDDLEQALGLVERGSAAVTDQGLMIVPPGLVRVGQDGGAATGVLGRRRALLEAQAQADASKRSLEAARKHRSEQAELEAGSRGLRDTQRAVVQSREQEHRRAEIEASGLEHRLRASVEAAQRQQRLLQDLEQRAGTQQGRAQSLEDELHAAKEALRTAEAQASAAADSLGSAEAASRSVSEEYAAASVELGRLREELVAASGRVETARQARDAAERALAQAREVVARAQEESKRVAARQAELGDQVQDTERSIVEVAERQEEVSGKLAHERRNQAEARRRVTRSEEKVTEAREVREAAAAELQKLELELQDTRTRIDLLKKVDARLPLELSRLPAVDVLLIQPRHLDDVAYIDEWGARLERTRKRLDNLGDVNLTAVDEYLELQARHEELMGQRQDLEASVSEIRSALARINRTCRERFRAAFDEVNGHFGALYERLSMGGKARLVLTDEEDLLETGVDIVAQPPGKRLRNLTLLSGGEKALVAIAVVFALFRVRPSPFCILDEVDAPLDEGNGARFNDLLRDMSRESQFIIITHNKKTIECADTLYGVTMQDAGISKLVTVRVH